MSDSSLWSDAPLDHPDDDAIGHSTFAFRLAEIIATGRFAEGYVVALTGEWGSGKSTCVRFVEHYLGQSKDQNGWSDVHVIHFNPWWFNAEDDLTARFFEQIQAEIAEAVTIPVGVKRSINTLFEGLRRRRGQGSPRHIRRLKQAVGSEVAKWHGDEQRGRILVVIDDLDRLATDEIREVFRLIKAVGDLPGFIYLACYDERVVTAALTKVVADQNGAVYLEKIVQLTRPLPPPTHSGLLALINHRLEPLVEMAREQDLYDEQRLSRVYREALAALLDTPRRINRVFANIDAFYPAVASEISFVDIVGLTVLRERAPVIYQSLVETPNDYLCDTSWVVNADQARADAGSRVETRLEAIDASIRNSIKKLLASLFPNCPLNGGKWAVSGGTEWAKARRICENKASLRRGLGIDAEAGQLGRARFRELVDPTRDELQAWLSNDDHTGSLGDFFLHLTIEEDRLDHETRLYVIQTVLTTGEAGWRRMTNARVPDRVMFNEVSQGIVRLIHSWLAKVAKPHLVEQLLARASLSWASQLVQQACWAHGLNTPEGGDSPEDYARIYPALLDEDATRSLRSRHVARVESASTDELRSVTDLTNFLYAQQRLGGRESAQRLAERIADEIGLAEFLLRFVPGTTNGVPTWKAERSNFFGERTGYFQRLVDVLPDLRRRVQLANEEDTATGDARELIGLLAEWFRQKEADDPADAGGVTTNDEPQQ